MNRRVVVTGIGVVSPLGATHGATWNALKMGAHGIVRMPEWDEIVGLRTRLAAPAVGVAGDQLSRKASRTMGRVAVLAAVASEEAIADARLSREELSSGDVGLAYGSTHGSSAANEEWVRKILSQSGFLGMPSTAYLKFMSHTAATNLAVHFGIRGRILTTCAACVSGAQAIGYAYETIKHGLADVMVAGGAEELHFTHAGVFDIMHATSCAYNDAPDQAPRPFEEKRDGLVVGEGAGTFVLEEYSRAKAANKHIYAEIIGFGTNCDGTHVTNPSAEGMRGAMIAALKDAAIEPSQVGYVNAHATATVIGDIAESQATHSVFGTSVPVSSLKGALAHTLGACGAIEAALTIDMMNEGVLIPTRNLERVDPRCAELKYLQREPTERAVDIVMSNKFAFGGINTSLIFKRA